MSGLLWEVIRWAQIPGDHLALFRAVVKWAGWREILEAVERALNEHEACAEVLHRLATARGAINSLMAELMEDHIRNHMSKKKSSEDAAEDLIDIVRTYLR